MHLPDNVDTALGWEAKRMIGEGWSLPEVVVRLREVIELTRRMVNVWQIIGIEILDHVIVGPERFLSMKEAELF